MKDLSKILVFSDKYPLGVLTTLPLFDGLTVNVLKII